MTIKIDDIPKGLVYLSMPYSHADSGVVYRRMVTFWKIAHQLIDMGVHVISPMSMEPGLEYTDRGSDWATWQTYCNALMDASEEIWVMTLDGWEQSAGVTGEIEYAKQHGKQVRFLDVKITR